MKNGSIVQGAVLLVLLVPSRASFADAPAAPTCPAGKGDLKHNEGKPKLYWCERVEKNGDFATFTTTGVRVAEGHRDRAGRLESRVTWSPRTGKRILIEHYTSGLPDGFFTSWNEDGKELGSYKMVMGTGTALAWWPNGNKKSEIPSKDGKPHGVMIGYAEDGKKQSEIPMVMGKMNGKGQMFHPNGKVRSMQMLKDDEEEGLNTLHDDKGVLRVERTWKAGKLQGVAWAFDDKGALEKATCMVDDAETWSLPSADEAKPDLIALRTKAKQRPCPDPTWKP